MSSAVKDLLDVLDLEPLEVNLFRGRSPQSGWQRVFGGQVIGQALVAAVRTVDVRPPHSLHAYFLLPGDPKVPIIYDVDRIMYLRNYLTQLQRATSEGVPVLGYFLWSLMDNFEWADGYEERFGLYHVDFATQRRTPKLSASFYRETIARNAVA